MVSALAVYIRVMRRRPRIPQARFPEPPGLSFRYFVISVLIHAAVLLALVWVQVSEVERPPASGFPGLAGGGGGGGGPQITYIALAPPPAAPSAALEIPAPPRELPLPVPKVKEITKNVPRVIQELPKNVRPIQLARTIGAGAGIGGGRGAQTGSGGGIGSGEGTGMGSEVGPGSGGDGVVFPPTVRYTFLPPLPRPSSVQGQTFLVRFAVDAQGRVADVEVEPRIPDRGYRKKFVDTMLRFRFKPAHLSDGTNVAGATVLSFTL